MSTINGLTGPRVPTTTSSAAREAPRTSFLSRVQAGASGAAPRPVSAPLVSGRDIVSKAISEAKKDATSSAGSEFNGEMQKVYAESKEMMAVKEMSRTFLMGTMASIFQGFGQLGGQVPQQD
jgi:6-phosphogluconate dehydrogenase